MPGVTRCTKDHSCWRDLCRPAYAVCRCRRATPAKITTESRHPATFSSRHRACAVSIPAKPPRYQLPVIICNLYPRKKASSCGTFQGDTTNILLVGSGKLHHGGPRTTRSLRCHLMPSKVPPAPESSAYQVCGTLGWAFHSSRMRGGGVPGTYATITSGSS